MKQIAKHASHFFWKQRKTIIISTLFFIICLAVFSYLTNPFTHFTIIDDNAISITEEHGKLQSKIKDKIYVKEGFIIDEVATIKSGWHILVNRLDPRVKTSGKTLAEIIRNTHQNRFGKDVPFLISGEHFSVLYPRSLGIFYHTILDSRTALNSQDWKNRQIIFLKTLTLILEVYDKTDTLSTTIVPIWRHSVTLVNIYAPPSDTLYSILFALKSLQSSKSMTDVYPFETVQPYKLQTPDAAQQLITTYNSSLKRHLHNYYYSVYDPQTGLVKKDIYLSSTKDSVKRSSSFYDNVIFWKTMQLAQDLGLIEKDSLFLNNLKQRILTTFWLDDRGYFLEELSPDAVKNKWYSSDWLIAYQTGFLDPDNITDRYYLEKSVNYVINNRIDLPFGMRYQQDIRPNQLHSMVRLFAREYGSTAIWSHWGMEWTKLLIRLSQISHSQFYLEKAHQQLIAYEENIERYGGYPEVYKTDGNIYRTRFYRGIRSTGWIVNYEQALKMYSWTEKSFNTIK